MTGKSNINKSKRKGVGVNGNLIPPKKGEIRNPKGKPKGTIDFARRVKHMLADPAIAEAVLKTKPAWWQALEEKDPANAMIVAMLARAISGDVKAFSALVKAGYSDKTDLTTKGERIDNPYSGLTTTQLRKLAAGDKKK